jgi:hypothetical protein
MGARRVVIWATTAVVALASVLPLAGPAHAHRKPTPVNAPHRPGAEVRGAPVDTAPVEVTQPDGTAFSARAWGDAASHGVETLDG